MVSLLSFTFGILTQIRCWYNCNGELFIIAEIISLNLVNFKQKNTCKYIFFYISRKNVKVKIEGPYSLVSFIIRDFRFQRKTLLLFYSFLLRSSSEKKYCFLLILPIIVLDCHFNFSVISKWIMMIFFRVDVVCACFLTHFYYEYFPSFINNLPFNKNLERIFFPFFKMKLDIWSQISFLVFYILIKH